MATTCEATMSRDIHTAETQLHDYLQLTKEQNALLRRLITRNKDGEWVARKVYAVGRSGHLIWTSDDE